MSDEASAIVIGAVFLSSDFVVVVDSGAPMLEEEGRRGGKGLLESVRWSLRNNLP